MTEQYQRLTDTLRNIFQMDRADLDFGIYRIMNMKRQEMNDFLEKRLLSRVTETLAAAGAGDAAALQKELEATIKQAKDMGIDDPDSLPKVKELRVAYQSSGSPEALANEVFSHLTAFFRRYYHQGDFISQRRYKKDVYAIPYEGEEVKLHWANHDQYYIKTGEHFRNYSFRTDDGRTVSFNLREATTEKDNNKGKNRFFRLCDEDFITEEGGELKIWFTYEPTDKKEKQDDLNRAALESITTAIPAAFKTGVLKLVPTDKNKGRTLLEKHLTEYTARNTFDYFIHKDLGGFLNRELDFYIKNEILHIDDIDLDRPERFDRQLRIIKALKQTARDIIALLAQLENFQKRLWLKKKFVVQSDWCITLDRIPEQFYPDIAANTAQREEWVSLFAIADIKGDLTTPAYSESLTVDFLKANPYLLVDTKFYSREWKYRLLGHMDNLEEQCDGLLINSENFQAIVALESRYNEIIDACYIDPPYNTDASPIVYKNGYQESSWLTLMQDRLIRSKNLMSRTANTCVTIDDFETAPLVLLLKHVFGRDNFLGTVAIRNNPSGRPTPEGLSIAHEYGHFVRNTDKGRLSKLDRTENQSKRYKEVDDKGRFMWELLRKRGSDSERKDSPKAFFPFYFNTNTNKLRIPLMMWFEDKRSWQITQQSEKDEIELWPIDENGIERRWRWGYDTAINGLDELRVITDNGVTTMYYKYYEPIGVLPSTNWIDSKYSATEHGTGVLKKYFTEYNPFSYPKSIHAVQDTISILGLKENTGICIDYFAGSGTTGHAVINLNREDGGSRKYILVEMGTYFNTVTKPRIQKVVYSKEWKDGKPVGREGISHCFKYLRLEGYEDTLNNLRMERTAAQGALLQEEHFGHGYTLHYMLGHESRESLLNLDIFKRPFGHTLRITENNETREQEVDLVETFNYLIGLVVHGIQDIRGTIVVQGRLLDGTKVLVIWRDVEQMDNKALDEFFRKLAINTRDTEFRRIYVNGDNNLRNLRMDDETWKVTLIEEEFGKMMFDVKDV